MLSYYAYNAFIFLRNEFLDFVDIKGLHCSEEVHKPRNKIRVLLICRLHRIGNCFKKVDEALIAPLRNSWDKYKLRFFCDLVYISMLHIHNESIDGKMVYPKFLHRNRKLLQHKKKLSLCHWLFEAIIKTDTYRACVCHKVSFDHFRLQKASEKHSAKSIKFSVIYHFAK